MQLSGAKYKRSCLMFLSLGRRLLRLVQPGLCGGHRQKAGRLNVLNNCVMDLFEKQAVGDGGRHDIA